MYIFFFCLFSVVCIAVMPFFLLEQRNPSNRSLMLKMICATMFLMAGIFAMNQTGANPYACFMVTGLACSWLGDFGLHVQGKRKKICGVFGVVGFFAAHIMYLNAYNYTLQEIDPNTKWISIRDIIIIVAAMLLYLVIFKLTKTPLSIVFLPLGVYVFVLMLMCIKALTLAFAIGGDNLPGALLLSIGAIFFVLSDTSLGILMFNKNVKKNFPFKIYNIITYFVGQLLLASTIFFIH